MIHKAKILTPKEVEEGRSSAYEYLNLENMTPKEKALELLNKYYNLFNEDIDDIKVFLTSVNNAH